MADKYLKESGTQLLVSLVKNSVNNALSKLNYYSEGNNTATLSTEHIYVTSESSIEMLSTNGGSYIDLDNSYVDINATNLLTLASGNWSAANTGLINISASIVNVHAETSSIHGNSCNIEPVLRLDMNSSTIYIRATNNIHANASESISLDSTRNTTLQARGNILLASEHDIDLNATTAYYNGNEIATIHNIELLEEKIDDLSNFTLKASFTYNAFANIQLLSLEESINVKYSGYSVNNGTNSIINIDGTSGIGNTNMSNGNVAVRVAKGIIKDSVYSFLMLSSNTDNISIDTCTSDYFKFVSNSTLYSNVKSLYLCPLTFAPNSSSCFYNWLSLSNFSAIENCATGHIENAYRMFGNCYNLSYANWVENMAWNSVTNAANMFYNCFNLLTISINSATSNGSGLTTNIHFENATNVSGMFYNCHNISFTGHQDGNGYANGFYTNWPRTTLYFNKATNTTNMFRNCSNLSGMIILHCPNVTCAANMFNGAGYFADSNFPTVFVAVDNSSIRNVILNGMSGATNEGDYYLYQNVRLYTNSTIMLNDCNHRVQ